MSKSRTLLFISALGARSRPMSCTRCGISCHRSQLAGIAVFCSLRMSSPVFVERTRKALPSGVSELLMLTGCGAPQQRGQHFDQSNYSIWRISLTLGRGVPAQGRCTGMPEYCLAEPNPSGWSVETWSIFKDVGCALQVLNAYSLHFFTRRCTTRESIAPVLVLQTTTGVRSGA